MISTRRKEAELQYIKARQNHTLALQKLNILMGSEPDAPIDSIAEIDIPTAPSYLWAWMMCCFAGQNMPVPP